MLIITREEAQEQGLIKYFTGEPCKFGHISERYVTGKRCLACAKEWRDENKNRVKKYNKEYKTQNKEKVQKYHKQYLEMNPDKRGQNTESRKAYYEKTKHRRRTDNLTPEQLEKRRSYAKQWRKKDHAKRYKSDPDYRCNKLVRNILDRTLKASMNKKEGRTTEVLGYSAREFRLHIERQFQKGMSWDNHGEWHIDHIYPIAKYVEDGITDPRIINALSNLTPIWKFENLSKGAMVTQLL